MLCLARLVVALMLVFVTATVGVRLAGGTRPTPVATLFSKPDGSPCQKTCLFGIVPGQTTASDALLMLKTHPLTSSLVYNDTSNIIQGTPPHDDKPARLGDITLGKVGNNLVDYIQIEGDWPTSSATYQPFISTLGDIITAVGAPRGIFDATTLTVGSAYFEFFQGTQLLIAQMHISSYTDKSVDPHDKITGLMLVRWARCAEYKDNLVYWSVTPWRGNATTFLYSFSTLRTSALHRTIYFGFLPCVPCQR